MIFKSFSQFLTESNSASFSPINEKQDEVFKLKLHNAETGAGESANFSIVAKINPSNDATEAQALNLIKTYTENRLADDEKFKSAAKGTVVFITIDRLKQRNLTLINNDQAILRAVLSFRMADRFDMTKAAGLTPYMKPGGIAIWLDTDMAKLAIEGQTVDPNSEENQKKIKNDTAEETETEKTKETIKPVELPAADAEVLAFLKEKLLGDGGKSALAKSGVKSREVKFAQLILLDNTFSTVLPNLKLSTTLGAADGSYGPKTALAYGIILDDKFNNPHNSIEAVDIEKLAKYCTIAKLLKPRLEQLWKDSELTKSGTPGTSGTAGTSGTSSQLGFVYIDKPGESTTPIKVKTEEPAK